MRIYTRTGDDGTTGLFGGPRTSKTDLRVEAYGAFDEANAALGLARASGVPEPVDAVLDQLQRDLFHLGAELACAPGKEAALRVPLLADADIERLERAIDEAESSLPPLRTFILPGGSQGGAALHLARCIVRRAERNLVRLRDEHPVRTELVKYANRLSDLLFVLARRTNHSMGVETQPWQGRPHAP